jgi:C4-dicarboxylate-specific signal transduction histidine kinase
MTSEIPAPGKVSGIDHVSLEDLLRTQARLRQHIALLEARVRKGEERRRALIHIMGDMNELNKRLANQRKAMIHIMGDLHETTAEVQRREQELRDKQEQLVQAGKLATLGELTTGVAHELNNPLNNIGLFIGNAIDLLALGGANQDEILQELHNGLQQVRKATEIITHLRTFGRAAPATREPIAINEIIYRSVSLMQEQLRLCQIQIQLRLCAAGPVVIGNAIQLEQVFINLLSNARDAVADTSEKAIQIVCALEQETINIFFRDSGTGIPEALQQRIFDPFFTTKEVGAGTGLGLSITYSIIKDHQGTIAVVPTPGGQGATFLVQLPLASCDLRDGQAP